MTYGIRNTVNGWPADFIVSTVEIPPSEVPDGFSSVAFVGHGPVILVPTVALTPVDTTPAEPEPGAWLIGDRVVERIQCDPDEFSPFEPECWRTFANSLEWSWTEFWKEYGGPGVTIRRLVPEPEPVELPWQGISLRGKSIELTRDPHDYRGVPVLRLTVEGESVVAVGPDTAERFGYALISGARAAREVKP